MVVLTYFPAARTQPATPYYYHFDESLHSTNPDDMAVTEMTAEKSARMSSGSDDLESQPILKSDTASAGPQLAAEYRTHMSTKLVYLAGYFLLNLSLTLYNKALLGNFQFPWLLTAIHSSFAFLGCSALQLRGVFSPAKLSTREQLTLAAFSTLFTINIAMSNVSLAMVSVPFHQIMRSTTPVFAILIHRFFYGRGYPIDTYLSLVPLIAGVALTTYGDYYFTQLGFVFTLIGAVLAAVKTVATNRLMTGSLALPALEVLFRMAPLAAAQSLIISFFSGEMQAFALWVDDGHLTQTAVRALVGNGILAFLLNVSSFQTNKIAGALTMTVCGNVKQCLTVLFGIVLFNVRVDCMNGLGMLLALGGAAWYSNVELKRKARTVIIVTSPAPDR